MAATLVGGSNNVILDLNIDSAFELTGKSNTGSVIQQINARIVQALVPQASITVILPLISDLNNRIVQFNLDSNDYEKSVTILAGSGNFINGQSSVTINPTVKNSVLVLTVTSADNYTVNVPLVDVAP
jgi:hypothetical protein